MEEQEPPPPPPPPPPRLRDPPALPDELVEDVLLRSPPDDPARLVRAALVCKRWSRLVSARAFRRRFRDFHLQRRGAPPMLGFLNNAVRANEALPARFVRTSASCPPLDTQRGWLALDARCGRVLLRRGDEHAGLLLFHLGDEDSPGIRLAVWDPLSAAAAGGGRLELPIPVLRRCPHSWNAALLCDHADGDFRVVLVGTDTEGTFVCVYSSLGPAAWSEPAYATQELDAGFVDGVRGAFVGNALYFLFKWRKMVLKYDLATGDLSQIPLPPAPPDAERSWRAVLTTTEAGGLGFARVEGDKLCLWSLEPSPNDGGALAMEWAQGRAIDLSSLLPKIDLLGFADGVAMILVGTLDGCFSIDQKSGRIDKLVDGVGFYSDVVPFVSFYTPALGKASTDERPSANA